MVMLAGAHVRAVDATESEVGEALAGIDADMVSVGATLEEAMVARERARSA